MNNFVIMTDSSCDLPESFIKQFSIEYIGLICNFNNKDFIEDCGKSLSYSEFYNDLRKGIMPTTSQINSFRFYEVFEKYAKENIPVVYIAFSSALSGTYNSSLIAKEEILENYPNADISIIDSRSASLGVGLLVYDACKLKESGASKEDIVNYLKDTKLKVNHLFTVDDLNHLKRGGRISPTIATIGTLLQLKPLLYIPDDGTLQNFDKVKGRKKSIKSLFNKFEEKVVDPSNQTIFISHGDCLDDATKLADMIREKYNTEVIINYIGLAIGSHAGPNALTLFFKGNNRNLK
ncbi:DegV family protein [Eubacterium multiforme]|uniref:DegV family protein with EDD domain n=1 Tax=Eubacterium multiforme TaxID=83339 RepID=A0ABT9UY50_9FIRM|nr:DegV family protein [Eubacterium multiforme]MDQ0151242.1 DegV family protein with EDD domain [Eubacterium multiforme]